MSLPDADPRWLKVWPARLTPLADLLCLPGAGAGASVFRSWAGDLPPFATLLAAQLPGREDRMDDPPAPGLPEAADALAAACLALRPVPRPLVIFGHSMGAVIGFETARRLAIAGRPPAAMVMSATTPPGGSATAPDLDPEALRRVLLGYDPANEDILAHDDLYASLAPVLGGDIAMLRRHAIDTDAPLDCSALLLSGASDPVVPPGAVGRWSAAFRGTVEEETLPGGHHFPLRESQQAVIDRLSSALTRAARATAP